MSMQLRIARPVSNLTRSRDMYCRGLGLRVLGSFADHDGYDGVMVGDPDAGYHLEFTQSAESPVTPSPTDEDLLVFYIPEEGPWLAACANMVAAGFRRLTARNPYWELRGQTYADDDGYRVVLQRDRWRPG